jgi:hypothetical protein
MDPLASKVANRYARRQMDPHIEGTAKAMLAELRVADAALHKALQHARTLHTEQSLDWMIDQVESTHEGVEALVKSIKEGLEYLLRSDDV